MHPQYVQIPGENSITPSGSSNYNLSDRIPTDRDYTTVSIPSDTQSTPQITSTPQPEKQRRLNVRPGNVPEQF